MEHNRHQPNTAIPNTWMALLSIKDIFAVQGSSLS
jgi:hypothetical protein